MYKDILIPTDGSELSEKAITNGVALAKALSAEITALSVMEPWSTGGRPVSLERPRQFYEERANECAHKYLQFAVRIATGQAYRSVPNRCSTSTPMKRSS